MLSQVFGCFLFVLLPTAITANNGFLHRSPVQALSPAQKSEVLRAIEEALGEKQRQATEVRLAPLEALLAPTLNALPKNDHGKFGHKAARYALHRLFVQRHAWFVKGIDISADFDSSSAGQPSPMLKDGVPDEVQSLFEARLGSEGLDAHEVAVMAATLENLAHAESMERLRMAFQVKGLGQGANGTWSMDEETAESVLDIYMAAYVTGMSLSEIAANKQGEGALLSMAEALYPGFSDVRTFVRDVKKETLSADRSTISFMDLSNVATRIGDKYGRWQHHECDDLKRKLFAIEDDGTGRVSLVKFYSSAVNHGHWQFSESPDYLRSLGALDESNPANPRVIVSNYVLSPSNCVASSSYYSVCCLDECEDLMDHLEQEIKAPSAKPSQIASLVAAMPSSTSLANRTIPVALLTRLDEIADGNEGLVPLHGRMFAQWMHHVYPRECPYPHMSGTFNAMGMDEYENATGKLHAVTEQEMREIIADSVETNAVGEIPWSHEDELYVEQGQPRYSSIRSMLRFIVFFIPALSTALFILRLGRVAGPEATTTSWAKVTKSHYV
jgi:hypothetical protein